LLTPLIFESFPFERFIILLLRFYIDSNILSSRGKFFFGDGIKE
jgi:hypothetical protein